MRRQSLLCDLLSVKLGAWQVVGRRRNGHRDLRPRRSWVRGQRPDDNQFCQDDVRARPAQQRPEIGLCGGRPLADPRRRGSGRIRFVSKPAVQLRSLAQPQHEPVGSGIANVPLGVGLGSRSGRRNWRCGCDGCSVCGWRIRRFNCRGSRAGGRRRTRFGHELCRGRGCLFLIAPVMSSMLLSSSAMRPASRSRSTITSCVSDSSWATRGCIRAIVEESFVANIHPRRSLAVPFC